MKGLFVTGTDTGVGKTVVAGALITGLAEAGFEVAAYKPVAAGCTGPATALRNDDALILSGLTGRDPLRTGQSHSTGAGYCPPHCRGGIWREPFGW